MKLLSTFTHITLIDDKKEEVQHILDIFHNQNIPYTYYQYDGTPDSLPNVTSSHVRLILMDLHLVEDGTSDLQPDVVSGRFLGVLNSIVKKNTPYILVVWSKHVAEDGEDALNASFESVKNRLEADGDLSPLALIPLDKKDIFPLIQETGQLDYTTELKSLEVAISEALENNILAKPLLHWNSLVGSATETTLNDIRELLVKKTFDKDFFERLLFEFARAYLGKHDNDKTEKYQSALQFITDIFKDNLEELIDNIVEDETIEFNRNSTNPPDQNDFALINFKTLISANKVARPMPGCTYSKTKDDIDFYHKGFYSDIFDVRKKNEELIQQGIGKKQAKKDAKSFIKTIFGNLEFITINLTPICDYAQNKFVYHKYCHGILLEIDFNGSEYLKINTAYLYKSPVFLFKDKEVQILIDFRLITDDLCDEPKSEDYLFRLREGILVDIQNKLSNHIGRPGIVFMDKNLI